MPANKSKSASGERNGAKAEQGASRATKGRRLTGRRITEEKGRDGLGEAQPLLDQKGREIQTYGTLRFMPIALDEQARSESCDLLNQILADTMILYNLYKKHHWLVAGHTFYQLHLLFDKHADEQLTLIDLLAERVQSLGGIAISDPRHVAEITKVERPPNGAEEVPAMISRLLDAHEVILFETREAIEQTEESKDWGTNDLLMSEVLRTNELQVWFVAEHVVDTPLVRS